MRCVNTCSQPGFQTWGNESWLVGEQPCAALATVAVAFDCAILNLWTSEAFEADSSRPVGRQQSR